MHIMAHRHLAIDIYEPADFPAHSRIFFGKKPLLFRILVRAIDAFGQYIGIFDYPVAILFAEIRIVFVFHHGREKSFRIFYLSSFIYLGNECRKRILHERVCFRTVAVFSCRKRIEICEIFFAFPFKIFIEFFQGASLLSALLVAKKHG